MILYHKNNLSAFTGAHRYFVKNIIQNIVADPSEEIVAPTPPTGGFFVDDEFHITEMEVVKFLKAFLDKIY